jgi:hypothetical protein
MEFKCSPWKRTLFCVGKPTKKSNLRVAPPPASWIALRNPGRNSALQKTVPYFGPQIKTPQGVTHVFGLFCYRCVRPLTLTPEYSRGVTFDLGQQFLNVFVLCVGFEEMPFTITVCTIQKPGIFLFVFLEPGYWLFGPD